MCEKEDVMTCAEHALLIFHGTYRLTNCYWNNRDIIKNIFNHRTDMAEQFKKF